MLQLASYCSSNSVEFTNRLKGEWIYRFDDPNFLMSNQEAVRASPIRSQIPAWDADDMAEFEKHLLDADVIVLSIYEMMTVTYFKGTDGLIVRFHEDTLRDMLKSDLAIWFVRTFSHVYFTFEERLQFVGLSIATLARRSKSSAVIVAITENVRKMEHNLDEAGRREQYNNYLVKFASACEKLRVIDVNKTTNPDWIIDGWHMTRQGYFELAQHVMNAVAHAQQDNALLAEVEPFY